MAILRCTSHRRRGRRPDRHLTSTRHHGADAGNDSLGNIDCLRSFDLRKDDNELAVTVLSRTATKTNVSETEMVAGIEGTLMGNDPLRTVRAASTSQPWPTCARNRVPAAWARAALPATVIIQMYKRPGNDIECRAAMDLLLGAVNNQSLQMMADCMDVPSPGR